MYNQDKRRMIGTIFITAIVCIIITFSISYIFFAYLPQTQRQEKVEQYKKAMFDSGICQYRCPFKDQIIANKTQFLPEQKCIQSCIDNSHVKDFNTKDFSENELSADSLFNDVQTVVLSCKQKSSMKNSTLIDNSKFSECSAQALENLKNSYSYLQ
jgi:hypothetical protein